jgi:hypothetical protein
MRCRGVDTAHDETTRLIESPRLVDGGAAALTVAIVLNARAFACAAEHRGPPSRVLACKAGTDECRSI